MYLLAEKKFIFSETWRLMPKALALAAQIPQAAPTCSSDLFIPAEAARAAEQPKDRIPTTPHPAANWDLARAIYRLPGLQVILNPFYHGQEGQKAMLN